jgi:hypothetical protein
MVKLGGRLGWTLVVWGATGCSHDLSLKFPDSSPGEAYVCSATARSGEKCVPAPTVDPSESTREGTLLVVMPRECKGRFNEITIHAAGSANPVVNVKCAPPENKIE